jgi:hypothetical protein
MANEESGRAGAGSLFGVVVTDTHFWIPLIVLLAGLVLLHELH